MLEKVLLWYFLHGFPEIWYSWRHQMQSLARAGYRAIAPDFKGYGLSQVPPHPKEATQLDLVQDTISILDAFGIRKEPGRAESDFGRLNVKTVIRNVYILFSGNKVPIANKDQEIMDLVSPSTPLPSWFSEDDLEVYSTLYENSVFQYPLEMPYRCMRRAWNKTGADDLKIRVPTLLIIGGKDYVLRFPGREDYTKCGTMKEHIPDLDVVLLQEESHFIQEQLPHEVNDLIINFLNKQQEQDSSL